MKRHPTFVLAALLGAFSIPAIAQTNADSGRSMAAASAPGTGTISESVKMTATVEAIDMTTRLVTLKGPKGKRFTVAAGPDVRNLAQVKVGDRVEVEYLESLTLTLKKDGKELRSSTRSTDGVRAPAGGRPAGAVAEQVEITADVIAVDAATQTVTLRGPDRTVDLKVRDPGQFKLIEVGDKVQAVYTQALAVAVEPAEPARR